MAEKRIKQTTKYHLFQRTDENRNLDLCKRKGLKSSMKEHGWIPSFPAVCRLRKDKMAIIDGQHRIAIAEELGLPVYFVLEDARFDIAEITRTTKPWSVTDYAQTKVAQGKSDYREGLEFAESHGLPISQAFALLAGQSNFSNVTVQFRDGSYRVTEREWAEDIASIYVPFVKASSAVRNRRFIEALMAVCRVEGLDRSRLLRGMERCRDKLASYSTRDAYLDMLEEIYNFGQRKLVPLKIASINAMKARNPAARKKQERCASCSNARSISRSKLMTTTWP